MIQYQDMNGGRHKHMLVIDMSLWGDDVWQGLRRDRGQWITVYDFSWLEYK